MLFPAAALFAVLSTGCTDTEVVFRDRPLFEQPPDSINEFLGYFNTVTKLTVCGNCHVGQQAGWELTGHMDAWAGLQASGHSQQFCEGCHAISELGNDLDVAGGINVTRHERYYDVQCENCHGSGFDHVQNPDLLANRPLARLTVDPTTACGECHADTTHHSYVAQWAESAHGLVPHLSSAAGRAACEPCHEGKAALLVKFGETANYVEKTSTTGMAITCGVCHDPHGSPYPADLRADIGVPTLDNFCVKCHSRTGTPPSFRGPHAAQGLLVISENVGWFPPNFGFDQPIVTTHGSPEANPRLCARCHLPRFTVTDAETGAFLLEAVGHGFEPIPCLDEQGLPTPGPCALEERDFRTCAGSACHASADVARGAYFTLRGRLNNLLDQTWTDTNLDCVIDPSPTDAGVLPQVVAKFPDSTAVLDPRDQNITVAEGLLWNAQLAHTADRPCFGGGQVYGINFSAHLSSGSGVHNPFLLEALVTKSIEAAIAEYGLTASASLDLAIHATPPSGVQ
jgi:predicted CXXCH cytochrome family protein